MRECCVRDLRARQIEVPEPFESRQMRETLAANPCVGKDQHLQVVHLTKVDESGVGDLGSFEAQPREVSEWLEMRFSSGTRTVVTIATIIALIGIVANNIVSMALVIVGYTGYPPVYVISALFLLFLAFTYLGGLWAVTLTDLFQFVIGLVVIPAILFALASNFGFIDYINTHYPFEGDAWNAGLNGSLSIFSLRYPSVLSVFFLFGIFLVEILRGHKFQHCIA